MSDQLRAVVEINYPDAKSMGIVRKAGGLSKLSKEQWAAINMKSVAPGGACNDLPKESRDWMIEQGLVAVVKKKGKK